MKILIIEDDIELASAFADFLELQQAECDFAYNGATGLDMAVANNFDIIILDVMLPKMGGLEVCERLRQQNVSTPVLMMTACDTTEDQLAGYRVGIDDYVIKPCPMPLLWAKLQALCKRTQNLSSRLRVGPLEMHVAEHRVTRDGRELKLTPTGWKLLEVLMRRSPKVVARADLEQAVWPNEEVDPRNFNVQLHQLRRAVDKHFAYPLIRTVVGVGICLRENTAIDG